MQPFDSEYEAMIQSIGGSNQRLKAAKYTRHEHLKKIAQETEKIVLNGCYVNLKGEKVYLDEESGYTRKGSFLLTQDSFLDFKPEKGKFETKISVTNEPTTAAIYRLSPPYGDYDFNNLIGVLNLASYRRPGGGWLNGAEAQEEHLAKCSDLVNLLNRSPEFYQIHDDESHANMALDLGILTGEVSFFRNPDYSLRDEVAWANVITVAAPDLRNYYLDNQLNEKLLSTVEKLFGKSYEEILESRARFILNSFCGHSKIVLGAIGCGVFRNDPKLVAAIFHRLLKTEFEGVFEEVVFAVLDSGLQGKVNHETFKKEFESNL